MGEKGEDLDAINAHLECWREISQRINGQLSPVIRRLDDLQKALQPVLEAREKLEQSLALALAHMERLREIIESIRIPRIPALDLPDLSHLTGQVLNFQRSIQEAVSPAFEQLQKSFRELPPRTQEALRLLGAHGWYLDLDMPIPSLWEFRTTLAEGDAMEAEKALVEYFENRVDDIEKSIISRFPHRKGLVSAAFNAHRRGDYVLSIPVLLAQTDGICKEVVKQYFFSKHNGKPKTAHFVEEVASDTLRAALLSPLAEPLPIAASERERTASWSELNRHMVLHGESLDYGNKVNGLKAISLINYVTHVLTLDNDNP